MTDEQCLFILHDWNIALESLNDSDLDELYTFIKKHKAYHLTRQAYIHTINEYIVNNNFIS